MGRHQVDVEAECPRCGVWIVRTIGASSSPERLRVSSSLRCPSCGAAEETDGDELWDEAREAFIAKEGRWLARVQDLGPNRAQALAALRQSKRWSPGELFDALRDQRPVADGSLAEMEQLAATLGQVGIEITLERATDAAPPESPRWLLPMFATIAKEPAKYLADERVGALHLYLHVASVAREDAGKNALHRDDRALLDAFAAWLAPRTASTFTGGMAWVRSVEALDPGAQSVRTFFTLLEEFLATRGETLTDAAPWSPEPPPPHVGFASDTQVARTVIDALFQRAVDDLRALAQRGAGLSELLHLARERAGRERWIVAVAMLRKAFTLSMNEATLLGAWAGFATKAEGGRTVEELEAEVGPRIREGIAPQTKASPARDDTGGTSHERTE